MKKVLIFSILVLFLGSLLALESGPSDVVGFVKRTAGIGFTSYAHPFTYYDATHTETMSLDEIIGTQLTGGNVITGDRIVQISDGTYAYLNSTTSLWSGGLAIAGFTDNEAYYFKVHTTHSAQDVYLCGTVIQESQTVGTCGVGFTWVGVREAGVVSIANLDLLTSGFAGGNVITSDRLVDPSTGNYAYYNTTTSLWAGTLANIAPGIAYQVKVHTTHAGFTWLYDPTTRDNRIAPPVKAPTTNERETYKSIKSRTTKGTSRKK